MKNKFIFTFFLLIVLWYFGCSRMIAPVVINITPFNDENLLVTNFSISFGFNKDMDRESVEKAFSLYDLRNVANKITGSFRWSDDRTMFFYPDIQNLHYPTLFQVNLEKTAADQDGNMMRDGFHSGFSLLSNLLAPEVTYTYPANESTNFSVFSNLIIRFNQPLLEKESKKAFGITPDPGGTLTVISNEIIYTPSSMFENGSYYSVTVSKNVRATNGAYMRRDYKIYFLAGKNLTVPRVQTVQTNLGGVVFTNGQHGIEKKTTNLIFTFNVDMDQDSVRNSFNMQPTINYHLSWLSNNVLSLDFDESMISSTNYLITIGRDASSRFGRKMDDDFTFRYFSDGFYSRNVLFVGASLSNQSWNEDQINFIALSTNSISLVVEYDAVTNMDLISLYKSSEISLIFGPDSLKQGDISDIKDLGVGKFLYIIDNISVSNQYKISLKGGVNEIQDILGNRLAKSVDLYFIGTN